MTECPQNCSGQGKCTSGECRCYPKFTGPDCSVPLCPNDCGKDAGWGRCGQDPAGGLKCQCNHGFIGDDCSLNDQVGYLHFNLGNSDRMLISWKVLIKFNLLEINLVNNLLLVLRGFFASSKL